MSELRRDRIESALKKRFKGVTITVTELFPRGFEVDAQLKTLERLKLTIKDVATIRVAISTIEFWIQDKNKAEVLTVALLKYELTGSLI